jgi:serine protease Do
MKKHLLMTAGLAVAMLALQHTGFAQPVVSTPGEVMNDTLPPPILNGDEIIIKHKSDKDVKVTIEIKNGQVFVNGKPAAEYQDDNLAISKRKYKTMRDGTVYMVGGDMASPFRRKGGAWSMDGHSDRAFLGVTSIRTENGPAGAKVGEVSPGSGAEKAGIKEGDLITKVDESVIDGPEDLAGTIRKYKPEDKVSLTFKRDGKEQKVTATLGKGKNMQVYGFKSMDGKDFDMDQFRDVMPKNFDYNYKFDYKLNINSSKLGIHAQDTEDGKGVKVLDVDDESAAAKAGIKEGDIITKFDNTEVNSATTLANAARESRSKQSVHVVVTRGGKIMDIEVKTPRKLKTADL